ncbi:hypothetical protein WGM54_12585 [Paenibacillus polymyxa]|uniref:hypothetical protein n=1 Tax=Paenibacillus polymyxa TaxID=1406 RepID=UPI00307D0886
MMVKKYGLKIMILFLIVLIDSVYITDVLTRFTINSKLQYFFILMYFFLIFSILLCFIISKIKKDPFSLNYRKKVMISLLVASILLFLGNSSLLNHLYKPLTLEIVASGEKNVDSKSAEVWVTDVFVNGVKVSFDYLPWSGNWQLKDKALLSSAEKPQSLKITLPASQNISVKFLKHEWSGIAVIKDAGKEQTLDLYSSKASYYEYKVSGNKNNPSLFREITDYLMAFVFVTSTTFIISLFIRRNVIGGASRDNK